MKLLSEREIIELLSNKIEQLEAERDSFYMEYRIKCDEQTKALHIERDELIGMRSEVLEYQREFHRLRDQLAASKQHEAELMAEIAELVAALSYEISDHLKGCECTGCEALAKVRKL